MNLAADKGGFSGLPPLALYVHLPWCVRKCPYCDFNSHAAPTDIPAHDYFLALLADLESELPDIWGRPVHSIFFGGGTPSLFGASWFAGFLRELRSRLRLAPDLEITLEVNPGTTERDSFAAYRDAGVNRVSLGVQSFNEQSLERIGRIHGRAEIDRSIDSIHRSGLSNFNIDLMFGLPDQTVSDAVSDIRLAIACGPGHLSHYQLTLEPNTAFHADPPSLPTPEIAWEMQERCGQKLRNAGFGQYEISAWARAGQRCRHNLNYWQYGDFLGIGAGAHSKITLAAEGSVRRRVRHRHPKMYLQGGQNGKFLAEEYLVSKDERIFEFFLNQLRLYDGVRKEQFTARTGIAWEDVSGRVEKAVSRGLLTDRGAVLKPTGLGWRFSNDTQQIFLPAEA
jgi:putative oxygen-independent coproporphyrinogen III oxidase